MTGWGTRRAANDTVSAVQLPDPATLVKNNPDEYQIPGAIAGTARDGCDEFAELC